MEYQKNGEVMEALYWLSSVKIWKTLNEIDFHLVLVGFEFPGFVPLACIKTVPAKVPTSALQTIITLERLVGFRQTLYISRLVYPTLSNETKIEEIGATFKIVRTP